MLNISLEEIIYRKAYEELKASSFGFTHACAFKCVCTYTKRQNKESMGLTDKAMMSLQWD